MKRFGNLSIRNKMALLVILPGSLILMAVSIAMIINERSSMRRETEKHLLIKAKIVGSNITAALLFDDENTANEILSSLSSSPHILGAVLYDERGRSFASYIRDKAAKVSPEPPGEMYSYSSGYLKVSHRITLNNRVVGSVSITTDLQDVRSALNRHLIYTAIVMVFAFSGLVLLSMLLQRRIINPLLQLSNLMGVVSRSKDYSVHAEKTSDDEIGDLAEGFNYMLSQIQERDSELQRHRLNLEEIVIKRTYELSHANRHLKQELIERQRIEEDLMKAKDAADAANRAKSDFLAIMSHEVRTPLNAIIGMTGLALETKLTNEQRRYLEMVRFSADSLLRLTNDTLDLSKIEAGKLKMEEMDFDLPSLMEGMVGILSVEAGRKGLSLLYQINPDVPIFFKGDPHRLRQVVVNLVNNAIKFTERGEIVLRVKMAEDERLGRYEAEKNLSTSQPLNFSSSKVTLHFSVSDTGIGIPKEMFEEVFERFSQVDSSTTRRYGGTGLGLSISRSLVEMMGGKIWLESEVGKGSTFHFTACFLPGETGEIGSKEGLPFPPIPLRVLLVEDNIVNQKVALNLLEKRGHLVRVADSGKEAIDILGRDRFDVVLTDLHMPDMDGFEAARLIRDPSSNVIDHNVPIIAMTADAVEDHRELCLSAGMNDYISKPLEAKGFISKVERFAKGSVATPVSSVIIDNGYLLERYGGNEGIIRELYETLLKDVPERIEEIRKAVGSGDMGSVELQAHSIKGSSGDLGLRFLRDAAFLLEAAAKERKGDILPLIEGLECEWKRIEAAIHEYIKGWGL